MYYLTHTVPLMTNISRHQSAFVSLSFYLQIPSNWTLLRMMSFSGNVFWEIGQGMVSLTLAAYRLQCLMLNVSEAAVSGTQRWKCPKSLYLQVIMTLLVSILKSCASSPVALVRAPQQGEASFKLKNIFSVCPCFPLSVFAQDNDRLSEIIVSVLN